LVIVALIAMVLIHELGHFATAKWSGMKVTEYFVGFGPRLWSVRKGETEYGVKAIPAGGYVRIIGMSSAEEIHPSDEARAYRNQPFGKRIIVASAGSAMHFLMAFVLAFLALTLIGRSDSSVIDVQKYLVLDGGAQTPAQTAGIQPGRFQIDHENLRHHAQFFIHAATARMSKPPKETAPLARDPVGRRTK
jgi:RIP metalloprotease RseP